MPWRNFFTLEAKTPRKWSQRLSTHLFVRGKLTTSVVLVDLAALIRSVWRVKTYGFVQGEYFKHGALGKYDCKLCFFFFFSGYSESFSMTSQRVSSGQSQVLLPARKGNLAPFFSRKIPVDWDLEMLRIWSTWCINWSMTACTRPLEVSTHVGAEKSSNFQGYTGIPNNEPILGICFYWDRPLFGFKLKHGWQG